MSVDMLEHSNCDILSESWGNSAACRFGNLRSTVGCCLVVGVRKSATAAKVCLLFPVTSGKGQDDEDPSDYWSRSSLVPMGYIRE